MKRDMLKSASSLSLVIGLASLLAACSPATGSPSQDQADQANVMRCELPENMASFPEMMSKLAAETSARMQAGVPVPTPVDAGGGYTHEQHKQNAKTIYEASLIYAETGDETYLDFVRSILIDYAELYQTLGPHPEIKSSNEGRLFWQGLNEAWWLVYVIQGYEAVRESLSEADRETIENGVLNPMADFLSEGSPQTFNRIHNHATWAAAAVGMTGYVLDQPERVEKALYGLDKTGEVGFLRQLDLLFSPDGYYAEGPYYQRYALMPFVLFAQYIDKYDPSVQIFDYRDGIVLKAVRSTLEQSYAGKFFPINDAIREKGIDTVELQYGVSIAYQRTGEKDLLDIARQQGSVVPTEAGKAVLDAIAACETEPFRFESRYFGDGPDGEDGALIVLRFGEDNQGALVFKATTQGLGHGHHDKLGLVYYDDGHEVLSDYGAARFLNVEAKEGGRYLPENETWAKQTIAHNTLVVDETSHFGGNWTEAQKYSPDILAYHAPETGIQYTAAEISTAYPGVNLQRILAVVPKADSSRPFIVDILRADSAEDHSYDLPMHFNGQLIETSFKLDRDADSLSPLGSDDGYQHLWNLGQSSEINGLAHASWLLDKSFYTVSFAASEPQNVVMTSLGANDPNFNLRHEQALIARTEGRDVSFVSVFERHGLYDSAEEVTVFDGSSVSSINFEKVGDVAVYSVATKSDGTIHIAVADDVSAGAEHRIELDGATYSWSGPFQVLQLTQ